MARGFRDEDAPVRPRNTRTVVLSDAVCLRESERAIYVRALDTCFWVPNSVVHDDSEVYRASDTGKLVLMEWWVRQQPWHGKAGIEL